MYIKRIKKILSKLSLIDWIIILVFASSIIVFYLFLRRYNQKILVRFKVTDKSVLTAQHIPDVYYANSFYVGDIEKSETGQVTAEIVNVESVKLDPNYETVYVDVQLKALYNTRTQLYKYKGRPIVYGESFPFTFSKTKFDGLVVDFPGFRDPEEITTRTRKVKAQVLYAQKEYSDVYGVLGYIADSISNGQTVINNNGEIMVKVTNVEKRPAKRTVITASGVPVVVNDPLLKDVYFELEIPTKTINGNEFMFYDVPFRIGSTVPINLPTISVWPTITEIVE